MNSDLSPLLAAVPWAVTFILLMGTAFLGWKIGLPAVKILQLEQHIKLLGLRQQEAMERAELAEAKATRLEKDIVALTEELKLSNIRLASLLTVIELKRDVDLLPGTKTVTTVVKETLPVSAA